MPDFYDFTLGYSLNGVETEIACRMAYTISPGRPQTHGQPEEPATLNVEWVKRVWPAKGGMTQLTGIASELYDLHCDDIYAAAMSAHQAGYVLAEYVKGNAEPDDPDDDRYKNIQEYLNSRKNEVKDMTDKAQTVIKNCNVKMSRAMDAPTHSAIVAVAEALEENAKALNQLAQALKPPANQYGMYFDSRVEEKAVAVEVES